MKKHFKIILALSILFVLTGCTKYMQYDGELVKNEETGQRMVENILCKTERTEEDYEKLKNEKIAPLREIMCEEECIEEECTEVCSEEYYSEVEKIEEQFDIEEIVYCSNFTPASGEHEGIWTSLIVKPLAFLLVKVGEFTGNYGWGIILVTLLIRLALYPLTKKTIAQSENMKKVQPKIAKLEEKYRNKTDQQSQMQKNQEMWKIYKENNINPLNGCIFAFIQIPMFLGFFEALNRLPAVLEERFLGINLGITPGTAFANGQYQYVLFVILVVAATYFSFKFNQMATMNPGQGKQMKMMMNFSIIMISISSFFISTGIALYWIVNSSFTVAQNFIVKRRKKNDHIT